MSSKKAEEVGKSTEERKKAKVVKAAAGGKRAEKVVKKVVPKKTEVKKKLVKKTKVEKKNTVKKVKPKKETPKKLKGKDAAKKIVKKVKKSAGKSEKHKRVAKTHSFTKYEQWVAEAIKANATSEKPYVSYSKVKQYVLDYMDGGVVHFVPKLTKKTLLGLVARKFLKPKKDSYAFTSTGHEKLEPKSVESRKKVSRPEKKSKKVVTKEEPPAKTVITATGRISRPTSF
jgi:hypothetical protein